MLSHSNLENYYQTQFSLVQHHKYSLTELESMIPYELDIYVNLLVEHIKKLEKERSQS
jgi:hypothetical protein